MLVGKLTQALFIIGRQRLQISQHQRALLVADGDLDLRQAIRRRHAGNQFLQRLDQVGNH